MPPELLRGHHPSHVQNESDTAVVQVSSVRHVPHRGDLDPVGLARLHRTQEEGRAKVERHDCRREDPESLARLHQRPYLPLLQGPNQLPAQG